MKTKTKNMVGNLLIITGALLIACFLWVNCSGRVYQQLYSLYYEYKGQTDPLEDDFLCYDDLPEALRMGQGFIEADADPGLERELGTEDVPFAEPVQQTEAPAAEVTEATEATEATETTEKPVKKKITPVFDSVKPVDYSLRSDYQGYDMGLAVPRMGVRSRIADGTGLNVLKKAPGLYEISRLPCEEKGNVIIAGHRDVYGAWFYSIDKMREGDKMKIYFGDKIYVYDYKDTNVVEKNDWSLLEEGDEQMLILTSCHPKGTSEKRIIVRGVLTDIIQR